MSAVSPPNQSMPPTLQAQAEVYRERGMSPEHLAVLGGKLYPQVAGLRQVLMADPRGLRSIETTMLVRAWETEPHYAEARVVVTFQDGSFYAAHGFASPQSIKRDTLRNPDYISAMAETRAEGRALRRALGIVETDTDTDDRPVTTAPDDLPIVASPPPAPEPSAHPKAASKRIIDLCEALDLPVPATGEDVHRVGRSFGVPDAPIDDAYKALVIAQLEAYEREIQATDTVASLLALQLDHTLSADHLERLCRRIVAAQNAGRLTATEANALLEQTEVFRG